MSSRPQARLGAGLVLVCALAAACRVGVGTDVTVQRSGSGSISVTVTADDAVRDALARGGLGDFGESLFGTSADRQLPAGRDGGDAFADLRGAGWQVDAAAGGVSIHREFAAGEDLDPVLAGLGGGDPDLSPIHSLTVVAHGGFPSDHVEVSGRVGLSGDAVAQLATQAGSGSPTRAEIEDVLGQPVTDLVTVHFHLDLPGDVGRVDADPAPASPEDLTWDLPGGTTLEFTAESSYWNGFLTWTFVILLVLLLAAVAFVVWRRAVVVRDRRRRAATPPSRSRPAPSRPSSSRSRR